MSTNDWEGLRTAGIVAGACGCGWLLGHVVVSPPTTLTGIIGYAAGICATAALAWVGIFYRRDY